MMIVCQGPPASGKSTFAQNLEDIGFVRINWDRMRLAKSGKWNREMEKEIVRESYDMVREAARLHRNVVVDNTNMNPVTRQKWIDIGQALEFDVVVKEFKTSLLDCVARDKKRKGIEQVGRPVIERMMLQAGWIDWQPNKKVVIFDMDGTLSDCSWRQHHVQGEKKNWPKFFEECGSDPYRVGVLDWAHAVGRSDEYELVIVSGRPEDRCGKQTLAWLEEYSVPFTHLFMRKRGDSRKDDIVKQEILDGIGRERVAFTVDDRPQVIRMWRANGVKCYDVGPKVEF